jgi:hypothetical protein
MAVAGVAEKTREPRLCSQYLSMVVTTPQGLDISCIMHHVQSHSRKVCIYQGAYDSSIAFENVHHSNEPHVLGSANESRVDTEVQNYAMHHHFIYCEGPNSSSPNHERDPATFERVGGVRGEKCLKCFYWLRPRHFRAGPKSLCVGKRLGIVGPELARFSRTRPCAMRRPARIPQSSFHIGTDSACSVHGSDRVSSITPIVDAAYNTQRRHHNE